MEPVKIIVVGDARVGKTAFVNRLCNDDFGTRYIPTLGVEISSFEFGSTNVRFWDCAGQHEGLGTGYYEGAGAAIVVFDSSSKESWFRIEYWMERVRSVCPEIPIVIVGNKSDLGSLNSSLFAEISAKTGFGIQAPLQELFALNVSGV